MTEIETALPEPLPLSGKQSVLLVDDDPGVLSSLRRLLRHQPYEVLTAETPESALKAIDRGRVSLILSDQRMPGMCGTELLEEVKRRSPNTARLMLTAYPENSLVSYGLDGCIDWLVGKPWNDEALKLTLRQVLHRQERRAKAGTRGDDAVADLREDSAPAEEWGDGNGDSPPRAVRLDPKMRARILGRLGCIPSFFDEALDSPDLLEGLWSPMLSFYIDNPLPRLFKERLFTYLSRFCRVPYPMLRHSCILHRLGVPASEILGLLEEPPPVLEIDVAADLRTLAGRPAPLDPWPGPGSELERSLHRCSVAVFLKGGDAGRCLTELRRLLGFPMFDRLVGFLGYIKLFHTWVEGHPTTSPDPEPGIREHLPLLLRAEPRLREFFKSHADKVREERRKVEDKLLDVITGLRRRETALEETQKGLETRVRERTAELSRVNGELSRDIEERKRAEGERDQLTLQLLQSQKLQAIGQLSAGIAHEINNPVGYILSNLCTMGEYFAHLRKLVRVGQDLERRLSTGADPAVALKQAKWLGQEMDTEFLLEDFGKAIEESWEGAKHIRDIVKSLKEFSHPDEGERKPADLNACLEDALRICGNELKYKAELRKEYGTLPPVLCWPQRLGQVFVNLLVNAVQSITEKGVITLRSGEEDGMVVVRIRDSGCGIPQDHVKRIFEPFFTTKPVGKGTGLGLHVAYTIVQAHGGSIEVQSEVGRGTEFAVRLPLTPPGPGRTP